MIATWLAGKVSGLVIFGLACLSLVLLPAVLVQTVRIDGLDLAGWYVVDGYRPQLLQMRNDNATLRVNAINLAAGIATCNASVDKLKAEGDARTADANAKIAAAEENAKGLKSAIDRMKAIKSSKETCPVADDILRTGLQ